MNSAHLNQAGISSPAFKFMFARRLHAGQGLWVDTKRRRSVLALHRAASKMGHAVASQAQGKPNSNQFITYPYKMPLHCIVTSTSKNLGNPQSSHFVPEAAKAHHETKMRFFGANTKVQLAYSEHAVLCSVFTLFWRLQLRDLGACCSIDHHLRQTSQLVPYVKIRNTVSWYLSIPHTCGPTSTMPDLTMSLNTLSHHAKTMSFNILLHHAKTSYQAACDT